MTSGLPEKFYKKNRQKKNCNLLKIGKKPANSRNAIKQNFINKKTTKKNNKNKRIIKKKYKKQNIFNKLKNVCINKQ